jgi:hypothetical protein
MGTNFPPPESPRAHRETSDPYPGKRYVTAFGSLVAGSVSANSMVGGVTSCSPSVGVTSSTQSNL